MNEKTKESLPRAELEYRFEVALMAIQGLADRAEGLEARCEAAESKIDELQKAAAALTRTDFFLGCSLIARAASGRPTCKDFLGRDLVDLNQASLDLGIN